MSYISLLFASIFEILWVALLGNFISTKSLTTFTTLCLCMGLSLYFLGLASKTLSVALSYGVWVGLGIVGQAFIQHFWFAQSLSWLSWAFIFSLTLSILGLLFSQAKQGAI